ncbi:tail fiber protein, partial [Escherichia coli]
MGNLNETEKWEENIYQLETSDPVLGGADGISNRAPRQLANRTKWLKKKTEEAAQSLAEHVRSRNHPDATLTAKGFTQLSSATNSTSETLAATPKAVK